MKRNLLFVAPLALVMASCETGTVVSSGDFDPLTPPGSGRMQTAAARGLKPGAYVRANMETAFFKDRPKGDATAEKTLPTNTEMKVISDDGSYAKVELDSGEVGYVPSVLVGDQAAPPELSPDAIQVYPPAPGSLPLVDPNTPNIPPVIDPDAPVVPDAPPIPDVEPAVVPAEPAPLPPGIESSDPPVEQ
jgi:hypothetical protein